MSLPRLARFVGNHTAMFKSRLLLLAVSMLLLNGCVDMTGRSSAQLTAIQPAKKSRFIRDGHVYCILGWLGVWSRGMDVIAQRADSELGVEAMSLGNPEWVKLAAFVRAEHQAGRWSGPLVLVGHSIGADDQIRVATRLNEGNIPVDLLLLIDPTIPPMIPPNVKHCVNLFKSHPGLDTIPAFRGIPVRAASPSRTLVENIDLRHTNVGFDTRMIDHFNIAKIKGVQDMALAEIAKACPLRKP
jgi:pimeloyl-ACP methyl ester carboxylesterase